MDFRYSLFYSPLTWKHASPNKGKSASVSLNTFLEVKLHLWKKDVERWLVWLVTKSHYLHGFGTSIVAVLYIYSYGSSWTGSITVVDKYFNMGYVTFHLHCTYINNGIFYKFLSLGVTVDLVYGNQYCRHINEGLIQSSSVHRWCFIDYHCKLYTLNIT